MFQKRKFKLFSILGGIATTFIGLFAINNASADNSNIGNPNIILSPNVLHFSNHNSGFQDIDGYSSFSWQTYNNLPYIEFTLNGSFRSDEELWFEPNIPFYDSNGISDDMDASLNDYVCVFHFDFFNEVENNSINWVKWNEITIGISEFESYINPSSSTNFNYIDLRDSYYVLSDLSIDYFDLYFNTNITLNDYKFRMYINIIPYYMFNFYVDNYDSYFYTDTNNYINGGYFYSQNSYDEQFNNGVADGYDVGYEEGIQLGYEDGYQDGYNVSTNWLKYAFTDQDYGYVYVNSDGLEYYSDYRLFNTYTDIIDFRDNDGYDTMLACANEYNDETIVSSQFEFNKNLYLKDISFKLNFINYNFPTNYIFNDFVITFNLDGKTIYVVSPSYSIPNNSSDFYIWDSYYTTDNSFTINVDFTSDADLYNDVANKLCYGFYLSCENGNFVFPSTLIPNYDVSSYKDGYQAGYNKGESNGYTNGYNNGYTDGNLNGHVNGYEDGYQDGVNDGITQADNRVNLDSKSYVAGYNYGVGVGFERGSDSSNMLGNMVLTVAGTPFQTFQQIWNFDVLGFNFASFALGVMTLLVIVYIIKKLF